jgi:uncharacterized protein YutE (UPF0331/DUF86 family)
VSPNRIDERIVAEKISVVDRMMNGLRDLPQGDLEEFLADPRTPAAAESYLRRALEALLDLGRHVLAKGFGLPVNEYAAIADRLREVKVLTPQRAATLSKMARYRNRMVHFYDEVTEKELYEIVTDHLGDFDETITELNTWLSRHPEKLRSE